MSRKFDIGRQSEQFYNEELYRLYELLRHIGTGDGPPEASFDGSLWLDRKENALYSYNSASDEWRLVFKDRFKLVDEIIEPLPESPVKGQLWINPHGVLHYHDGTSFVPVRAEPGLATDYPTAAPHLDFLHISPLMPTGNKILLEMGEEGGFGEGPEPVMQFLVPNTETTRVFMGGDLDRDSVKLNQLTLQHAIPSVFQVYELENPEEKKEPHGDPEDPGNYYETYDLSEEVTGKEISGFVAVNINGATYAHSNYVEFDEISKELTFKFMELVDDDLIQVIYSEDAPIESFLPHVIYTNPDRLTKIKKRLFEIDQHSGIIQVPPQNAEFYLFKSPEGSAPEEITGLFLEKRYYKENSASIELKTQKIEDELGRFDYLLAAQYDFSWHHGKGSLRALSGASENHYYAPREIHPFAVFTGGEKVNPQDYSYNKQSELIELSGDSGEVGIFDAPQKQHGHIARSEPNSEGVESGVIRLIEKIVDPLIFVNGLLVHKEDIDTNEEDVYKIAGAMPPAYYAVLESEGIEKIHGEVGEGEYIKTAGTDLEGLEKDEAVLFLDGLVVNKDQIELDSDGNLTAESMTAGQSFTLLWDTEEQFREPEHVYITGAEDYFHESLVYINGRLALEPGVIDRVELEHGHVGHNEIQRPLVDYLHGEQAVEAGKCYRYNNSEKAFIEAEEPVQEDVEQLIQAYENATSSVVYKFDGDPQDYNIDAFLFRYIESGRRTLKVTSRPCFPADNTRDLAKIHTDEGVSEIQEGYENGDLIMDKKTKVLYTFQDGATQPAQAEEMLFLADGGVYEASGEELFYLQDIPPGMVFNFMNTSEEFNYLPIVDPAEEFWHYKNRSFMFIDGENIIWKIPAGDYYIQNKNALALYLNGVRQYENAEALQGRGVKLPGGRDCLATYVIEHPKEIPYRLCEIIKGDDLKKINGATNLFEIKTGKRFYPGHTKVYLGGLRQSSHSYKIIDQKKIQFLGPHIEDPEEILIEVREDFSVREQVVQAAAGQSLFSAGPEQELPADFLRTEDERLIYIGGLLYNQGYEDYSVRQAHRTISLLNRPFVDKIEEGEQIIFEWRN